jgi:hypothetical protein
MYNEMSFLFSKDLKVDTQRTNGIPLSNIQTLKERIVPEKQYVVYKDKNFFKGQNGAIRNYIKEKIYDNDSTDTNPYIQLLKDPEFQKGSKTLRPSDFSYLRDMGVYPLNRLIILRRFPEGAIVTDDLNQIATAPLSVVIGWITEDSDLFNLSFNEEWDTQEKYLHEIIADILKNEFKVGGAEKVIPSAGWTQGLLFGFLKKMGLTDDSNAYDIPFGDPNLLREGAYRDYTKQGLKSSTKLSFETVYEQKLIGEFDPATAMLDTIRNLLSMGTSNTRYIFSANSPILQKLTVAVNDKGNSVDAWTEVVREIVQAFIDATVETFSDMFGSTPEDVNKQFQEQPKEEMAEESRLKIVNGRMKAIETKGSKGLFGDDKAEYKRLKEEKKSLESSIQEKQGIEDAKKSESEKNETVGFAGAVEANTGVLSGLLDENGTAGKLLKSILASTFAKHRWPIRGSIGAMTGQPTAPWHITIGNPWSPIISAGNMIVEKIDLSAKGELGFNDMPIFINANISLRFGRNLGAQEIERIFNNGYRRIYNKPRSDASSDDKTKPKDQTTPPTL